MLKLLPKDEIETCQNLNSHINPEPMINLLNSKLLLQNINNNINTGEKPSKEEPPKEPPKLKNNSVISKILNDAMYTSTEMQNEKMRNCEH